MLRLKAKEILENGENIHRTYTENAFLLFPCVYCPAWVSDGMI